MSKYSLSHLSDRAVLNGLKGNVENERGSLAMGLAHIGEAEERRLFVPAAHPSMKSYLMHELHFSEQAALKRLRASRTARKYPVIFTAVERGRLNLSAVVVLAAHLTPENADQLVETAANLSKAELERMLSGRDAEPEGQTSFISAAQPVADMESQVSPGTPVATQIVSDGDGAVSSGIPAGAPTPRITVEAEELSDLHCQIDRETRELLLYAKALLSHAIPNGNVGKIIKRAAKALVREVEKEKFGATDRPGKQRGSVDPRYIPYAVKREVWLRDRGQCAFVSEEGNRCPAHELIEFHHIEEVAIGGTASVRNISLRCRTHNQYESEKSFGKAFMENKREQAKAARGRASRPATFVVSPEEREQTIWWLGIRGYSREDAQWALDEVGPRGFALPGTRGIKCLEALKARAGDTSPLFS